MLLLICSLLADMDYFASWQRSVFWLFSVFKGIVGNVGGIYASVYLVSMFSAFPLKSIKWIEFHTGLSVDG